MTDDDERIDGTDAAALIDVIKRTFEDVDRPLTAREAARLYGVMAAQHEANLAVYSVAMQANPQLIFSDASKDARAAMNLSVQALTDALRDLAYNSIDKQALAEMEVFDGDQ